jgi:hypothetical protein
MDEPSIERERPAEIHGVPRKNLITPALNRIRQVL